MVLSIKTVILIDIMDILSIAFALKSIIKRGIVLVDTRATPLYLLGKMYVTVQVQYEILRSFKKKLL